MKALDTNVLVRYLVQDDPDQARRAGELIEAAAASGERLLLGAVVLCELVWVLESAYGVGKEEIVGLIEKILMAGQFELEDRSAVWAAWNDFRVSSADFSDCLLGRRNRASGCDATYTFDRAAAKLETFVLV